MRRSLLWVVLIAVLVPCSAPACDFKFDPAALPKYIRDDGWQLPGINDWIKVEKPYMYGLPDMRNIPNVQAHLLPHRPRYIIDLPAQVFTIDGKKQRMRHQQAIAQVVRWEIDGKIVAFSYGLIPVTAHKVNEKWIIDSELLCIFTATYIDDRGDGVFRVLVPGRFTPDLIPEWAKAGAS